jgi:glycosyltransferase involved in cell wall biosynthesis
MIVYVITKLELGGAQKVCLTLFNELSLPTTLISGNEGPLAPHVQHKSNVLLLDSFKREVSWKLVWAEIKTMVHLIKQLRQLKQKHPHIIVHTHSTKAGLVGRWAALFAGIKKRVHTVHGYGFHDHQSWYVWWTIYFMELVTSLITTHYVCVSGADVATGLKLFPRFAKKHSVIRAAVDFDQFTPATRAHKAPQAGEPFIFGTVSCLKLQKNVLDMIYAFKVVHTAHPYARLEIIGDGVMRPAIENAITELQLTHVVTLHGWKSPIAPLLASWHTFVLSSLWEGLPCAVVEARLMQLPVIAYDTGGIYEVIQSGSNGFLVPQKDRQGLAQAMLKVIQEPALYTRLCNKPEDLQAFQASTMLAQHETLYHQLRQ